MEDKKTLILSPEDVVESLSLLLCCILIFYALTLLFLLIEDSLPGVVPHNPNFRGRFSLSLLLVAAAAFYFETLKSRFQEGMTERQGRLELQKKKLSVSMTFLSATRLPPLL